MFYAPQFVDYPFRKSCQLRFIFLSRFSYTIAFTDLRVIQIMFTTTFPCSRNFLSVLTLFRHHTTIFSILYPIEYSAHLRFSIDVGNSFNEEQLWIFLRMTLFGSLFVLCGRISVVWFKTRTLVLISKWINRKLKIDTHP